MNSRLTVILQEDLPQGHIRVGTVLPQQGAVCGLGLCGMELHHVLCLCSEDVDGDELDGRPTAGLLSRQWVFRGAWGPVRGSVEMEHRM